VVAGEWWTPVIEHAHQTPAPDVRRAFLLGQKGHAQPAQRREHDRRRGVEDKLAIHVDVQFAAAALEFPRVQAAARRQAQIDAAVACQVAWRLRCRMRSEVDGRGNGRHPQADAF
jgi:hypothetical protein